MSCSLFLQHGWAGALAVVLLAAPAPAGVAYLDQSYRVVAGADDDAATSPPGRTLTAMADDNNADFHTTASATQDVTADDAGVHLTGRLSLDVDLLTAARDSAGLASYDDAVRFSIDRPYTFRFAYDNTTEQSSGVLDHPVDFRLFGPGESDPALVFDTTVGERQGRLEPGVYNFSIHQNIFAEEASEGTRIDRYDARLDLTPVDGGGPTPVPLPPGLWGGLVTMGGAVLVRWKRQRPA